MGYILLWVESLAAGLLLFATATAIFAKMERGKLRWLIVIGAIAFPMLIGTLETAFSIFLRECLFVNHWLTYTLSWTLVMLAGIGAIRHVGLRRREGVAPASSWPVKNLAIGLIAASALHLITFWNLDGNMRLRLASVRMEAGAMALAAAPPRVPDHDNAALVYEKCYENDVRIRKTFEERPSKISRSSSNFIGFTERKPGDPELAEYLQQMQPTLVLLRRAAAMPGCYFEHEYSQPSIDMTLPELSHMRQLGRILAVDAKVKAVDGKFREALEDINAMRGLSRHVATEPLLISGLVSMAIENIASSTLEAVLVDAKPAPGDFAGWQPDDSFSFRRALRRSMAGEEACGMSAFAMLGGDSESETFFRYNGLNPDTAAPVVGPYWRVFLLADDLSVYHSQMKMLREMADQDYPTARTNLDALDLRHRTQRLGLISEMMLPMLSRAFNTFVRAETSHRLADVAVAVAAYRAKNGKYPARPQELVPEFIADMPIDPYDNKPLRMIPNGSGVTLYSIGEDMQDGGGAVYDFEHGDVLFNIGTGAPAQQAGQPPQPKPAPADKPKPSL